jgi:hypothetical protein
MTHMKVFKKYYIATINSVDGHYKHILDYKTRGRVSRVLLVKYNKRIRGGINKTIYDR